MTIAEAVSVIVSLDMRGLLSLPSWVRVEDVEDLDEALRTFSVWSVEEKERQLTRC